MRIDVITLFPEYLGGALGTTILSRAIERALLDVRCHDPHAYTHDRHRTVDDAPFGGGAGMVMLPGPIFELVEVVGPPRPILSLSPTGRRFDQRYAAELAALDGFTVLCGRYEGIDQRVVDHLCDGEVSIGDYVLAGGEAAALVMIEAVARLVPGVLGNESSSAEESFSDGLLEYPQYTRPAQFRDWGVPEVLRSGDHGRITRWRRAQALRRTLRIRPDLLGEPLSAADTALLGEFPPDDGFR